MNPSTTPSSEAEGADFETSADAGRLRILLQRAKRYARRDETVAAGERCRLLFFQHGGHEYAIPLGDLREVRVLRSFCPIPGARKVVPGIFYYRGEVLSLHDLAAYMGGSDLSKENEPRWVLIVERDRQRLGLMARDVLDVRDLPAQEIRPAPITLGERAVCVQGVVRNTTLLLRTEALFSTPAFFRGL
jgi:purine-binding chemotaxis protein CheW